MKLCPRCRLPVRKIGRAYACSTDDGNRIGVVAICNTCTEAESKLPRATHAKRMMPGLNRALLDPAPYFCTLYDDIGKAELAVGMLGHHEMSERALAALGWLPRSS